MYKALVTGGTQGIGKSIADALLSAGYRVYACSRTAPAADAGNPDSADSGSQGTSIVNLRCDVTKPEDVEGLRKQIGSIDVLVNNAGMVKTARFLKTELDDWDRHWALNVKGVVHCIRAFLPDMLEKKRGRIINIASTASLRGYPYVSAYVATKHAVLGLTRSLAAEVAGEGITVNAICPSYVDTPMLRQSMAAVSQKTGKSVEVLLDELKKQNPQGRFVSTEEIADAVLFLIATSSINGQAIALDGGETA